MKGTTAIHAPSAGGPEQLKRSIDSLQRLYTIVIGLAVAEGLRAFLAPEVSPSPWWANWRSLGVLLITVVPFYHGANGHLDQSYIYGFDGTRREKRYALLFDFCVLFVEGVLFFAMALSLNDFARFVRLFQILLAFDVLWAVFVYFSGDSVKDAKHALKWGGLNVVALLCVSGVQDSAALIDSARSNWVLGIAVIRTLVDYGICWDFYMARYPMMASAERA